MWCTWEKERSGCAEDLGDNREAMQTGAIFRNSWRRTFHQCTRAAVVVGAGNGLGKAAYFFSTSLDVDYDGGGLHWTGRCIGCLAVLLLLSFFNFLGMSAFNNLLVLSRTNFVLDTMLLDCGAVGPNPVGTQCAIHLTRHCQTIEVLSDINESF